MLTANVCRILTKRSYKTGGGFEGQKYFNMFGVFIGSHRYLGVLVSGPMA